MRSLRLAVALVCTAALSVGCSDDAPTAAAPSPSPSAAFSAGPTPSDAGPGAESSQVPPVVAPGAAVVFETPTGNIRCGIADQSAVCEVRDREYAPPPKPADCDLDHGSMVAVGREGAATFLCYGDTSFGVPTPVLGYGRSTTNGLFMCSSSEQGVMCKAARSGRGFELARGSFRLF